MKILHITNELTKKNFSIASIIIYISKYLLLKNKIHYNILTSFADQKLFDKNFIDQVKFNNLFSVFTKYSVLIEKIKKFDVIHIHGVWAPIQLFSIVYCNLNNCKFIIQPHGMLLSPAIQSGGVFKFCLKKIFLFFFKIIISKNAQFIAITNQEKIAIKRYFLNSNVKIISNPIPFEHEVTKASEIKKQFVYFGRIHPHKNIHKIIEAFKISDLNKEWKLKIYGIEDDSEYFQKLKKLIKSYPQIEILSPVFGKEKQKILNNSWANILISKSEVLSLSILEAGMCSLPSLVNQDIELIELEDSVIKTRIFIKDIKKKIELLSNWTLDQRIKIGEKISNRISKINSIKDISKSFINFYKESFDGNNVFIESKNKNFKFLVLTGNYTFNLMYPSFVVILLVIFGQYSIAGELGLWASFWITLTQIFSSNMRSIIISESNIEKALKTIIFRITFSLLAIIFFLIFLTNSLINFENNYLIISFSFLILTQWTFEMHLVIAEVKKKSEIFKILTFINLLSMILTIILVLSFKQNYLANFLFIYSTTLLITNFLLYFSGSIRRINYTIIEIIYLNVRTIAFLSSLSIIISSFIWRIALYLILDKSLAGIFFASFAIGSFPGTVFNTVIGPTLVKEKIKVPNALKYIFILIFLLLFLLFIVISVSIFDKNFSDYLSLNFAIYISSISLLGSFFMCYAMYLRHKSIQNSVKIRNLLFRNDILYGLSITFLIPMLYYLGNLKLVSFAFFIASLIALYIYSSKKLKT